MSWLKAAGRLDWDWLDAEIAPLYSEVAGRDRDSLRHWAAVAQAHLRAIDEEVCERWVYDPYFQYLPARILPTRFRTSATDLSHWRKRLGEKLALSTSREPAVAPTSRAVRRGIFKRVTVDTPCSPRPHVSDRPKLLHAAIQGLNRLAAAARNTAATSYLRIAKRPRLRRGAYAHAKQFIPASPPVALLRNSGSGGIIATSRKIAARPTLERCLNGAHARQPDPFSAACAARLEAVFLPAPRSSALAGQGQRTLRVRRQA